MSSEQKGIHNPGNWSVGKNGHCVVSDQPGGGIPGSDDVQYYGGYLIAESVGRSNIPIIAAAPNMLKALLMAREAMRGKLPGRELETKFEISAAIAAATTPIIPPESPQVVWKPAVADPVKAPAIEEKEFPSNQQLFEMVANLRDQMDSLSRRCSAVPDSQGNPEQESPCDTNHTKPPLGIKPERLWLESRRDDIYAAVSRYRDAGYVVPLQWLDELCAIEVVLQAE